MKKLFLFVNLNDNLFKCCFLKASVWKDTRRNTYIKFGFAVDKEEMFFYRNLYVDSKQNTVAILQSVEIRKILESVY